MELILSLEEIGKEDRLLVGGKAYSLAAMKKQGLVIPDALCVTVEAYDEYVTSTGLRERIMMELSRKSFGEMRWEEMWDTSLRIRNMFLKTPIPNELFNTVKNRIEPVFKERAVVVRSSALGEDSSRTSFAGLHESYVNIRGIASILDHVRLVWASLWSDRALLYRQELGLDVDKSKIGVVIQEIVVGEKSGIVFGKSPDNRPLMIVEAVYGLNQGLVDGTLAPDRWLLERDSGRVVSYTPAERDKIVVPSKKGTELVSLQSQKGAPPVSEEELLELFDLALKSERVFGSPQDIEWTFAGKQLYILQSRPITTIKAGEAEDDRTFYLGLRKSFESLKALRKKIEEELIPAMIEEGKSLSTVDPSTLSDEELAEEIERRSRTRKKWVDIYWKDFIPFAHGVRLFGQVYNDAIRPTDPYEFTDLLTGTRMLSLQRNRLLEEMSLMIREDKTLSKNLTRRHYKHVDSRFEKKLQSFTERFGNYLCSPAGCGVERETIIRLLLELASKTPDRKKAKRTSIQKKEQLFLSKFEGKQKQYAIELLDLARASYRLRDDDNIHLGNMETQLVTAVNEASRRTNMKSKFEEIDSEEIAKVLRDKTYVPKTSKKLDKRGQDLELSARQLTGQPASPGVANAKAHVISKSSDLFKIRKGEVLVCDAIDPNMTFVVPLSSAIVERRGGMLIHGAIIAREYGVPCVTGIADATRLIHTGDQVVVDGYLGIVTITSRANQS